MSAQLPPLHWIDVVVGDIADAERHQAEAYVVAANNELWMGSGVAGALKRAAGVEVEREAVAQGPIEVGDAVVTGAGMMPPPARALIHAAAMGFTDRTQIYATPDSVRNATLRVLALCDEHGFRSVVFPALGTGVGGLDDAACASAMVGAITRHLGSGSRIEGVRIVVTNEERAALFQREVDASIHRRGPALGPA
jgi:O-acetyl-ADP-ribose deacetylase (regulator of RNase III)